MVTNHLVGLIVLDKDLKYGEELTVILDSDFSELRMNEIKSLKI